MIAPREGLGAGRVYWYMIYDLTNTGENERDLFIAITATFYPTLSSLVPGVDVEDPAIREQVQPLTRPPEEVDPELADAAREASTDAFRLAMLVSAGLLVVGAGINAAGIRNQSAERRTTPASADAVPPA